MAGIYIHIPFCSTKCHYCNFFSTPNRKYIADFTQLVLTEIDQKKHFLANTPIETIYIGGGTPSLLPANDIKKILDKVQDSFDTSTLTEVTIEANPESLTPNYLKALKNSLINRLSIGIQSFHDKDLIFLNRAHSSQTALNSIKTAQDLGFYNLNIDLIYGIPSASTQDWEQNLMLLESLNTPHLSAYALTQESGTAYDGMVKRQKVAPPSEDSTVEQYHMLQAFLPRLHMEQYEISNYAKEGQHAIHNSHYWMGKPYLGLGPSAHSLIDNTRFWNVANIKAYTQGIAEGNVIEDKETLSLADQWNELMLMPLRTKWGLKAAQVFHARFPQAWQQLFQHEIAIYINKGWVSLENKVYKITPQAKLMADGIAERLFVSTN